MPDKSEEVSLLSPDSGKEIDAAAAKVLKETGAPSASIAVVKDGKISYAKAYGFADVSKHERATTSMRYSIGSISKQFTATTILLLAEDGKLSLDDPISRWFPGLTRAHEINLRQVLSMTSGYQDFWPEDYVMPPMFKPTSPEEILSGWAKKPLDFDPGTKWQYSNTNYVIAGLIAEKTAGMPVFDFLKQRVFAPLRMENVYNSDQAPLPAGNPQRYLRYGLGPVRPAPKEGRNWMFAAGELAMTATDLAKWDISMINQSVLKPAFYQEMETAVLLKNGASSQYGLGVGVSLTNGRRMISHGGEVSGFTAQNSIYPDNHTAVVVLTNLDATSASQDLARKIADLLFAPAGAEAPLTQAKAIFAGLQKGRIDRTLLTANANAYFDKQALQDFASSLAPLGKPKEFTVASEGLRGGMTFHRYKATFPRQTLTITTYTMPNGKLEQYMVAAE